MENSVDSSRPVECYRFEIAGYPEIRYTSDEHDQVAEGQTYTAFRGLKRSPFVIVTNGEKSETTVTFPADSDLSLKCGILNTARKVVITIKRYERSDMNTPTEVFSGTLASGYISGEIATLKFPDKFSASLSTKVPKNQVQGPCNWNLGDRNCKKDVEPFKARVVSIVQTVVWSQLQPGDYVVEASFLDTPIALQLWQGGPISVTQGLDTEIRTIHEVNVFSSTRARIHLTSSFTLDLTGADIFIWPGCDNSKVRCRALGNEANFGGFPYVPTERDNPFHDNLSKGRKV